MLLRAVHPPGDTEERSVHLACHRWGESTIESAIWQRGQLGSELSGMKCYSPALVRRLDFRTVKRFLRHISRSIINVQLNSDSSVYFGPVGFRNGGHDISRLDVRNV